MKILNITSDLDGGGVDRLLFDYCSQLINDIQFDFVVNKKREGMLEQPLKDLGCNIFHITQIRESFKKHNQQLEDILKANQYDIVHDHSGYKAWCNLRLAKRCGIKVCIAHAHQAFMTETFVQKNIRKISTVITKFYANELFACGSDAAKWMWGNKAFCNGKVYIMKNAICAEKFDYSFDMRKKLRNELNITDKYVIGNVARLTFQKNQKFLVDIFAEIKKVRKDAVLMLVGRGDLENDIRQQVKKLGLSDSVFFMGVRNDVPYLLNAMDVFVLPSRFEGLPVTLIEIQANGLPAVISDVVTKEAVMSNEICFMSLSKTALEWAKKITEKTRTNSENIVKGTSYDLNVAVKELRFKYFSML